MGFKISELPLVPYFTLGCPKLLTVASRSLCSDTSSFLLIPTKMSSQTLDAATRSGLLSILLEADIHLISRLLRMDLPENPFRALRDCCFQGFQGKDATLIQLGYQEQRGRAWMASLRRVFSHCQACKRSGLTISQTTFSCGHSMCNSCICKTSPIYT